MFITQILLVLLIRNSKTKPALEGVLEEPAALTKTENPKDTKT